MRFQKRMPINPLVMLMFIIQICWISRAINSCSVSPSTVEIVDDCPDSEEKWREAAARKNCLAFANQCDEPRRLVYHCVINTFVNYTLEVCAYSRIILLGFCTEYNLGGNIIQQNIRADCTNFTQSPCPSGYPSTDAYKYPDCYKLPKQTTGAISTLAAINTTQMNGKNESHEATSKTIMIVTIPLVLVGLIMALLLVFIWKKKKCSIMKKDHHETLTQEIHEGELLSLKHDAIIIDTEETETGNKPIAPSGQNIESGDKMRNIMPFEEETLPEHFLKPEKGPEQDCQILLSLLSDGLERLAVMCSEISCAENQVEPNLGNLHHDYYDPKLKISQESTQQLKKDLEKVESLTEYFQRPRRICKE